MRTLVSTRRRCSSASASVCLPFLGEYLSIEIELSAEDDVLLDEDALLAASERSAPNFVARVSDGGIGPKAGLKRAACRLADACLRFAERWIIRASHLQQLLQRQTLAGRRSLG